MEAEAFDTEKFKVTEQMKDFVGTGVKLLLVVFPENL